MSSNLKQRLLTSIFLFFIIILIFKFYIFLLYSLIVIGILSVLEFFNLIKKIFKNRLYIFFSNIFFVSYVFSFCLLFFLLSAQNDLKLLIFIILLSCISSDIGGLAFGKILKGPKLTKISPNKTFSGAAGSLLMSSITFSLLINYFYKVLSFEFILIGFLISIGCQIGDLFFSYLKRKAKLKDTGSLLPGHGGILDRLDGIFLGLPVGLIFINII